MFSLYEQLRQAPYVRPVVALVAGILCQVSLWELPFPAVWPATGMAAIYITLLFTPSANVYSRQWLAGITGLTCLFFIGMSVTQQQPVKSALPTGEKIWIRAEINDAPLAYPRYTKIQALVDAYMTENGTRNVREKVLLYLAADSITTTPPIGSIIYAQVKLSSIAAPGNPDEFDYRDYLARRKIFTSAFVEQVDYTIADNPDKWKTLRYLPTRWQQYALEVFKNSPLGEREYAVLVALTLGNKQWLDDEIRTSYVSAGAMHILAVSGLHVGIIMVVLGFMFSFLNKRKHGIIIKNATIIIGLWLYASIIGFSPSVTRATVMFSFVLTGQMMRRKLSIYNSLAASAFFICLFNPLVIFEAGFQLSYCAVLSIVYFQARMAKLLYIRNKLLNNIWQLATVSFAAQIGTLPISLFNFHLFPNYFLLTNICIITLTGFIVYGGVLFLAIHQIPVISTIVGYILHAMLWLLNHIVEFVESLPYSVTPHIFIDRWQMTLLILIILLIALYLAFPRRIWLWATAYALTGIIGIHSFQSVSQNKQSLVVVYKTKNVSYIQFIDGKHAVSVLDSACLRDDYSFYTGNFMTKHGVAGRNNNITIGQDTTIGSICIYNGFVIFRDRWYKILQHESVNQQLPPIPIDYLIVTGNARMSPASALTRYVPKQIILDTSVPAYRATQWANVAETTGIPLYNVRNEGAFVSVLH